MRTRIGIIALSLLAATSIASAKEKSPEHPPHKLCLSLQEKPLPPSHCSEEYTLGWYEDNRTHLVLSRRDEERLPPTLEEEREPILQVLRVVRTAFDEEEAMDLERLTYLNALMEDAGAQVADFNVKIKARDAALDKATREMKAKVAKARQRADQILRDVDGKPAAEAPADKGLSTRKLQRLGARLGRVFVEEDALPPAPKKH